VKGLAKYCLIILVGLYPALAGEYSDSFMELGVSARDLAMGNALSALDRSTTAFIRNPAGLAYIKNKQVGLMYTSLFGLADHNYFGTAFPISKRSSLALSWIRFGVDDIPKRPDILRQVPDKAARRDSVIIFNRSAMTYFSDRADALFLSYGRIDTKRVDLGWKYYKFNVEIPWGINFKILHKRLYNLEAYGLGLDIGGRIRFSGEDILDINRLGMFTLGLALKDITGTTIYWNTKHQDRIDIAPVIAFAWEQPILKWKSQVNFCFEKVYKDMHDTFRYGIEFVLFDHINFRSGFKKSGFTAGLGLNFKLMHRFCLLDYSFLNHELGSSHRIGCGVIL